ncbi:uncharacterized protein LOC128469604 isoform X2 [Spea bombifrons]|uniref:uncharacterized protein LOC128469604 isoform X2 n=1 Tax=Spea bombifrons TaxID=233779 RepID=UPI002349DD71|nr:uncharacterized protein LOC128469604 isoform X2 [Spea bombifrons]
MAVMDLKTPVQETGTGFVNLEKARGYHTHPLSSLQKPTAADEEMDVGGKNEDLHVSDETPEDNYPGPLSLRSRRSSRKMEGPLSLRSRRNSRKMEGGLLFGLAMLLMLSTCALSTAASPCLSKGGISATNSTDSAVWHRYTFCNNSLYLTGQIITLRDFNCVWKASAKNFPCNANASVLLTNDSCGVLETPASLECLWIEYGYGKIGSSEYLKLTEQTNNSSQSNETLPNSNNNNSPPWWIAIVIPIAMVAGIGFIYLIW